MLPFFISDEMGFSDEELLLFSAASGKAVEDTATGNPIVFTTDIARPLKSLLIPFTPQQEGTGDPSPQNIRSIIPWNGLTVFGGGKNLLNPSACEKRGSDNLWWYRDTGMLLKAGTYCFSFARVMTGFYVYDLNTGANLRTRYNAQTDKFTLTEDHVIRINVYVSGGLDIDEEAMLEVGQTATAYEPYKPITETAISFPSPVYGGTLDVVSGVLTVEWTIKALNEWYTFNRSTSYEHPFFYGSFGDREPGRTTDFFCDVFKKDTMHIFGSTFGNEAEDLSIAFSGDTGSQNIYIRDDSCLSREDFLEAHKNDHVCYKLATPVEIQLTPAQITALVGDNTMWSDADGSMTAVYLKKG